MDSVNLYPKLLILGLSLFTANCALKRSNVSNALNNNQPPPVATTSNDDTVFAFIKQFGAQPNPTPGVDRASGLLKCSYDNSSAIGNVQVSECYVAGNGHRERSAPMLRTLAGELEKALQRGEARWLFSAQSQILQSEVNCSKQVVGPGYLANATCSYGASTASTNPDDLIYEFLKAHGAASPIPGANVYSGRLQCTYVSQHLDHCTVAGSGYTERDAVTITTIAGELRTASHNGQANWARAGQSAVIRSDVECRLPVVGPGYTPAASCTYLLP